MARYTDILLDLDDTLIDTEANTKETVKEVYCNYSLGNYFDSFENFFSFYYTNVSKLWDGYNKGKVTKDDIQRDRFAVSLRHLEGITEERIQEINAEYIQRVMEKDNLIEGAMELLDYLRGKYKIHILSNGFTEMQYKKMESAGLQLSYFDNIILSDEVGVNKPHPGIFEFSLNKISEPARNVIMIGDNIQTDISGAYHSGIDQIWFNPKDKPYESFKPTYTVRKLEEIREIL